MEKTRFGIPAAVVAAVICLLGQYSGYLITVIAVAYVLLAENSAFLKRMAMKVLAVMLIFSLANTVISLIPDLLSLLQNTIWVFDKHADVYKLYNNGFVRFLSLLTEVLGFVKMLILLVMAIVAPMGKELKIPVLDDCLNKLLEKQAA